MGATIAGGSASRELAAVTSELEENAAQISDAKSEIAELEAENASLEKALDDAQAEVEPSVPEPAPSLGRFPDGFPVIVPVSELPDQVRNWYEMSSITQAVALAPGVWTELPPGADIEAAVTAGIADGFCASVEAYERDYAGKQLAGTCW